MTVSAKNLRKGRKPLTPVQVIKHMMASTRPKTSYYRGLVATQWLPRPSHWYLIARGRIWDCATLGEFQRVVREIREGTPSGVTSVPGSETDRAIMAGINFSCMQKRIAKELGRYGTVYVIHDEVMVDFAKAPSDDHSVAALVQAPFEILETRVLGAATGRAEDTGRNHGTVYEAAADRCMAELLETVQRVNRDLSHKPRYGGRVHGSFVGPRCNSDNVPREPDAPSVQGLFNQSFDTKLPGNTTEAVPWPKS